MRACVELDGRSLSQYSQFGRSCNAMIVASSQCESIIANRTCHSNGEFPSISDERAFAILVGWARLENVGPWWARGACHRARIRATRWLCPPYNFCHSRVILAMSAVAVSRIADGVREKRGAGAGWVTPCRLTKIWRAAMCGWFGASLMLRTGAQQMS